MKEVHYNQHGLLLLAGKGIYRLGDVWFPVQAGDVIWMAPYVPQWYAALGTTESRYIIYKVGLGRGWGLGREGGRAAGCGGDTGGCWLGHGAQREIGRAHV